MPAPWSTPYYLADPIIVILTLIRPPNFALTLIIGIVLGIRWVGNYWSCYGDVNEVVMVTLYALVRAHQTINQQFWRLADL